MEKNCGRQVSWHAWDHLPKMLHVNSGATNGDE